MNKAALEFRAGLVDQGDIALEIVKKIIELSPFYASEMDGDTLCFFCDKRQLDSFNNPEHEPDCLYVRAEQLVKGLK